MSAVPANLVAPLLPIETTTRKRKCFEVIPGASFPLESVVPPSIFFFFSVDFFFLFYSVDIVKKSVFLFSVGDFFFRSVNSCRPLPCTHLPIDSQNGICAPVQRQRQKKIRNQIFLLFFLNVTHWLCSPTFFFFTFLMTKIPVLNLMMIARS